MQALDITGQKFHHLTAVRYVKSVVLGGSKRTVWLFRCVCGAELEHEKGKVTNGRKQSCGCQEGVKREKRAVQRSQDELWLGLEEDRRANRAVVPPSMRNLPSRLIKARHAEGRSFGVGASTGGVSSLMLED